MNFFKTPILCFFEQNKFSLLEGVPFEFFIYKNYQIRKAKSEKMYRI
jgi:hypothetical protein